MAYSGILWHTLSYSGILWHTLAYSCILWHTLAYSGIINASLITADGAYHYPMGSIWPFLAPSGALIAIPTYYWSSTTPLFQITPVLRLLYTSPTSTIRLTCPMAKAPTMSQVEV